MSLAKTTLLVLLLVVVGECLNHHRRHCQQWNSNQTCEEYSNAFGLFSTAATTEPTFGLLDAPVPLSVQTFSACFPETFSIISFVADLCLSLFYLQTA